MAKKAEGTKKKAKPENQQHKTVYFNTLNANDRKLFEYANSIGVRNFSGFVKSLIYQDMIKRNGVPPNPYEYASGTVTNFNETIERKIPVKVRRSKPEEFIEETEDEVIASTDKEDDFEDYEKDLDEEDIEEQEEVEEIEEEEEEPQTSVRSSAAAAIASMYKRN